MVADSEGNALELMPGLPELSDGSVFLEKAFGGARTQRDHHLGFDDVDFGLDEGKGTGQLFGRGFAIVGGLVFRGRSVFTDVGDVNHVAGESHGLEDLVEFLAGGAHEGFGLELFVVAGGFSDEHEVGPGIPAGEDHDLSQGAKGPGGWPGCRDLFQRENLFFRSIAGCSDFLRRSGFRGDLRCGGWVCCGLRPLFDCFPAASPGVELAEDCAGFVIDRDMGDALVLELEEIVENCWGGHGARRTQRWVLCQSA